MRGIRLSVKLPVLVVLAVLLMAVAGSLLAIFIGRNTLRTRELGHNVEAANAYAGAVNSYLDNARSILETTAGLSEIKDFATVRFINPALHGIPASVDKPKHKVAGLILKHSEIFEYVMLLQAEGSVYMLEPYDLQIKLSHHNLAFTDWYKKLMSTGNTVISDLHISPATQRPTVVIATPVRSSAGKIIGIWTGALKLKELSEIGRGELGSETPLHYGYVTDNRGLVIAHQSNLKYVEEQTDFSSVLLVHAALSGQKGATQFIDTIEREEKLGAYLPLSGTGWAVVYVVPTTIAFAPMNELARNIILIAAGLAALLGFVSWIIVRQIVRPLGRLTAAAATIGTGNFTQRIELRTDDEIGKLSEEFNRMAAALSDKETQLREYTTQLETSNKELETEIAERKRTEETLRQSEEKYRTLVTNIPDITWTTDSEGNTTFISPSVVNVYGYTSEDIYADHELWLGRIHPDDIDRVMKTFQALFTENKKFDIEYRVQRKDGVWVWLHDRSMNTYENEGKRYADGVFSDITERKRAEEEINKLNEELKRNIVQLEVANKELEAFSYSVSHDLRAPLRGIDGFSRIVLEDYTEKLDDEGRRYLNIIRSNTQKMGQLIDDLLLFSRLGRQELRASSIDMGKLAKAVSEELKLAVPERKLKFTINTLIPAQGDQAMIRQVLVNLLSNAVKFTRPKERAVIEVDGRSEGNENVYTVKDNGVGFDMQYVNKLFGVFQRLHSSEEFEGTGVGLAIVQRIIHRHGGRVWAEGKVGEGASFYFSLPAK